MDDPIQRRIEEVRRQRETAAIEEARAAAEQASAAAHAAQDRVKRQVAVDEIAAQFLAWARQHGVQPSHRIPRPTRGEGRRRFGADWARRGTAAWLLATKAPISYPAGLTPSPFTGNPEYYYFLTPAGEWISCITDYKNDYANPHYTTSLDISIEEMQNHIASIVVDSGTPWP